MKFRDVIAEAIKPPVTFEQVVTPEWVTEVLDYGFDVGIAHPDADPKFQGDDAQWDHQSVMRMLYELQDDGVIPEDVDVSDPRNARPHIEKWFRARYNYVLRNIEAEAIGNGYRVHRAMTVPGDRATSMASDNSPLGTFWSFSHGEAHWGSDEHGELHLEAAVARGRIDWITTIRRNMNYALGEDELEVFLPHGTPVRLLSMSYEGNDIPVSNAKRVT